MVTTCLKQNMLLIFLLDWALLTRPTPMDSNFRLTPYDGVPLKYATLYWQLADSLIYLTLK